LSFLVVNMLSTSSPIKTLSISLYTVDPKLSFVNYSTINTVGLHLKIMHPVSCFHSNPKTFFLHYIPDSFPNFLYFSLPHWFINPFCFVPLPPRLPDVYNFSRVLLLPRYFILLALYPLLLKVLEACLVIHLLLLSLRVSKVWLHTFYPFTSNYRCVYNMSLCKLHVCYVTGSRFMSCRYYTKVLCTPLSYLVFVTLSIHSLPPLTTKKLKFLHYTVLV
jgi:hypothetical protein